jgi:hypothetical protein
MRVLLGAASGGKEIIKKRKGALCDRRACKKDSAGAPACPLSVGVLPGAPDRTFQLAGQKLNLKGMTGHIFAVGAPQIAFREAIGGTAGDALRRLITGDE